MTLHIDHGSGTFCGTKGSWSLTFKGLRCHTTTCMFLFWVFGCRDCAEAIRRGLEGARRIG